MRISPHRNTVAEGFFSFCILTATELALCSKGIGGVATNKQNAKARRLALLAAMSLPKKRDAATNVLEMTYYHQKALGTEIHVSDW